MASSKLQIGRVSSANSETNDSCVVGGSFAYMLMVTSIFGMAPLQFKSHEKGFRISVSKPMCIYSYVLVFCLASTALFGKVLQLYKNIDTANADGKLTQLIFLYFNLVATISTVTGVMGGPKRMKNLIMYLNKMAKVDLSLGTQYSRLKDIKIFMTAVTMFITLNVLMLHAVLTQGKRGSFEVFTQAASNIAVYLEMSMYLQLDYICITICNRFRSINDALTLVTCQWSEEVASYVPEPVNMCITCDTDAETDSVIIARKTIPDCPGLVITPNEALQRITILRGSLCDIINSINRDCGLSIVITLLSAFGGVVATLYFMIFVVRKRDPLEKMFGMMNHCLWLYVRASVLIHMTEPCHNTMKEDQKTRKIICHMMRIAPPSGTLLFLLEMFGYQVMLKPASYEPLNMCTVNRLLMVTILGAVSTYLVILVQF